MQAEIFCLHTSSKRKINGGQKKAMDLLNHDQIFAMYEQLGLSVAVIDRDLKIIYRNQAAQAFYSKFFGEREYLGYSTKNCHSPVHQKNINALFLMFAMGKPMNFYHAKFPQAEGGELTLLQLPYFVDGKVEGIVEIGIESSLMAGGRGEHRRVFREE